jgi:hypothetical protein
MLFGVVEVLLTCIVQGQCYCFKIEWISWVGQVSIKTGYHYNRLPEDIVVGLFRVFKEERIEENDSFLAKNATV